MAFSQIQHIFVLMFENRSFDHLLGFSAISGTDAVSGLKTPINGLSGTETNTYDGKVATVCQPADYAMAVDPGHEFDDVLCQLGGSTAKYVPGGDYPPSNNSGFVASYAQACSKAHQQRDVSEILKCYSPNQIPVLHTLAQEFAICDRWHASMPGPTWPNRMFVHAASSAGLDHSPTTGEIALWETAFGFSFPNGDIFDKISAKGLSRRIYAGDEFPMTAALKGIQLSEIRQFRQFADDLQEPFPYNYVFIEPSYALLNDYKGSTSEHPLDDIRLGEDLLKATYEAVRNSPVWKNSLLIITWDEHGGFFDHASPPAAVAPGDTAVVANHNKYGFTFEQYGPRVPAVIISPWIPRNVVDHRLYDHSSIPATIEKIFGIDPLTERDRAANPVLPLLSLDVARDDTPITLPSPASSSGTGGLAILESDALNYTQAAVSRPSDSVNDGNLPIIIHSAMRQDIELSAPEQRDTIIAKVAALKSRSDGAAYLAGVSAKRRAAAAEPKKNP
ncbi:MAG TPA: alkaline phosphatase family protein [Candidatus Saccharimonadales bacterium]|jgi:phospholipase C|nr:alkaline phosphatase family protein [Candidatus Saccharimonadales bacterium]